MIALKARFCFGEVRKNFYGAHTGVHSSNLTELLYMVESLADRLIRCQNKGMKWIDDD